MFCLPIPHDKCETKTPVVVVSVAVICAVMLIPVLRAGGNEFVAQYGFRPGAPTAETFFASMFLHAGIWHYAGNMWFFWIFGRKIEATLGHLKFLVLFLVSGVGATLLYWALSAHSMLPLVGASGAISGVAGAYLAIYPNDRFDLVIYLGWIRLKRIESNAKWAVGAWIGEQLVLGLLSLAATFSSTAFFAHVGGFAVGVALGWLYRSVTPEEKRPVIPMYEFAAPDEVAAPNTLTGLGLSGSEIAPLQYRDEPGSPSR